MRAVSSGLHNPPLGESDTRSKLIDPAICARGWTEEHIRREETAGAVEIIDGMPRRRSKGRVDYTLRVKVATGEQPVTVAIIEAKAENLPPGHGLEQGKSYARCKRMNVPFVFSSNGHMFVEYGVVSPNEVLIARSNTTELVGRVAMFTGEPSGTVASDLTIRIWAGEEIEPQFLTAYPFRA